VLTDLGHGRLIAEAPGIGTIRLGTGSLPFANCTPWRLQAAEHAEGAARAALVASEDGRTDARLCNLNGLLRRVCSSVALEGHTAEPSEAAEPKVQAAHSGRASAEHWLAGAGAGGAPTTEDCGEAQELRLDSAQVKIRVLAHANKEVMVRNPRSQHHTIRCIVTHPNLHGMHRRVAAQLPQCQSTLDSLKEDVM
jgi:hypothetical protein